MTVFLLADSQKKSLLQNAHLHHIYHVLLSDLSASSVSEHFIKTQ